MTAGIKISPALRARAMKPRLKFGRGILRALSRQWRECLVVTQDPVWKKIRPVLATTPIHVHLVESMDRRAVEDAEKSFPPCGTIVGMGGGAALDMAKYVAWIRGMDPILVPGIASVDACVTNTIAVRDDGKVKYIGFAVPRSVVCDFELMAGAPKNLNRAGIGDILSIHTGLHDWALAGAAGEARYLPAIAAKARALVDGIEDRMGDIRAVTDDALEYLIRAYAAENALCLRAGHSRPEEGSEHFFAYAAEHLTRKTFVHGELVCLGVHLMTRLQDNQHERMSRILRATGVRYHPADLGISRREMEKILRALPAFVATEGMFYSVIQEKGITAKSVTGLLEGLRF